MSRCEEDGGLAALLAPGLAPLFTPPPASASSAHAPFLHWLLPALAAGQVGAAGQGRAVTAALRAAAARMQPAPGWTDVPAPGTDLLLIEAAADPRAVLAAWTPQLSGRAVVLLAGGGADTGLTDAGQPHFVFDHDGGLVVLAVGAMVPGPVAALCRLPDPAACRARFAGLGAAWQLAAEAGDAAVLRADLAALLASSSWRLTAPVRAVLERLRRPAAPPALPAAAPRFRRRRGDAAVPQALFVAAEPQTPGALYRCVRPAAAAAAGGWQARWRPLDRTGPAQAARADVLVLWRGAWGERVAALVAAARSGGAKIVLDLDDLVSDPDLVRPEVIDAIRTGVVDQAAARLHAERLRRILRDADAAFAATAPLAAHLRAAMPGRPVFVLPNAFDAAAHARARRAARARARAVPDGRLRIGYAGGTRTHQRDFAAAAPAVARLLAERQEALLVLFTGADGAALLDPAAFPELARHGGQIEWRRAVTLSDLPDELARFDINLAPLDAGNPFCEAKSEIKFVEAALVGVPTIASPTEPLAAAIADGTTGRLAGDAAAWQAALGELAADAVLRRRLAAAAYDDVLRRFGPERAADATVAALDAVRDG